MTDPDDRDMLAAEYVLGTLDAEEREGVAARLTLDVDLARAVREWQDRLSPLADAVPDVAPPAGLYEGIAARLFGAPAPAVIAGSDGAVLVLRRKVRRWQGATAGFALLAAALSVWIAVREAAPSSGPKRFAAVLQRDAGAPAMLVDVDLAARRLTVRPLAASPPPGRVYELWIIDPSLGAPRSLGLIPDGGEAREGLKSLDPAVVTAATYAVTLEAPGGSPTGQPTSAPVLSGRLWPSPP